MGWEAVTGISRPPPNHARTGIQSPLDAPHQEQNNENDKD